MKLVQPTVDQSIDFVPKNTDNSEKLLQMRGEDAMIIGKEKARFLSFVQSFAGKEKASVSFCTEKRTGKEKIDKGSILMKRFLFTSESVTEGHPDKICDQISDAVLDEILSKDPQARVACETTCTTGIISIMGEITTSCYVDIPKIARSVVLDIGYDRAKYGFDGKTCAVVTSIDEQSPDIALGVDKALEVYLRTSSGTTKTKRQLCHRR